MSTISAGVTSGTALVNTGNTDGTLQFQVNGTTPALTLNASGAVGVGSTPGFGTNGQVLTSAGSAAAPTWTTPSGANFQEFTSSGTWTKPSGANFVMVEAWGGGAGGGSGRRGAANTVSTGGGGGGGGAYVYRLFKASDLASTVTVTIGAGGSGGAAVTVDSTNGNSGSTGGTTTFGSLLTVYGGNGGQGGSSSSVDGGLGGGALSNTQPQPGPFASGLSGAGHFGASYGPGGQASGFGGGSGGTSNNSGTGNSGGSSYQGGPAGGGGSGFSSSNGTDVSGNGGGITSQSGTGAIGYAYPGTAGSAATGRQGGAGGTSGYSAVSYTSPSAVAFGNSTFALATKFGKVLTSSNGTNAWVYVATPSNLGIYWILHDGTQFVLFDAYALRCWTTTNFSSYTEKTGLSTLVGVYKVKYQNSRYFICTPLGIYTSTDLNSWSLVSTGIATNTYDICWSGTNYVVTSGTSPFVRYSPDLTTWTTSTGVVASYQAISNGSGTVVISDNSAKSAKRSTNNGTSFTDVTTTLASNYDYVLGFANSTYFFSDGSSNLWTSTDGTSWTLRISATGEAVTGLAYDGTTYVTAVTTVSSVAARTSTPAGLGTWTDRSVTARDVAGGTGGVGGQPAGGGGGGGSARNGSNSGAGGAGGAGLVRVYTW